MTILVDAGQLVIIIDGDVQSYGIAFKAGVIDILTLLMFKST